MNEHVRGEVNMRLIHALTDYASLRVGRNAAVLATERALAANAVDEGTSGDPHAWVSLEAFRAVADALAATVGAAVITDAVTWVVPTRRDLSAMSLTAVATPRTFFANIDHAREFFARHLRFEVGAVGRGTAKLRLSYRAGAPRHAHSCQVARGVLCAVPLLFDLPPAELDETQCFAQGADACEYVVRWQNEKPSQWIGAAAGLAVLAVGMPLAPGGWWALAPAVGYFVGRELRMARLRSLMTRTTEEQRRVLGEHERELTRRFDELRASNVRAEQEAVVRAAALEETLQRVLRLYESTSDTLRPLDLAAEVGVAVTPRRRDFGDADVELDLQPARIAGHVGQLGRVALDLVTNAARAMGGKGTITVRVFARDGRAILSVEDTGPGVLPDLREKVFERGFTTKPGGESGTGLGLTIARTIVERHAGRIAVRSGSTGGATFDVTLPLLADDRDAPASPTSIAPATRPA
jgi:signal transduction histidine kinase